MTSAKTLAFAGSARTDSYNKKLVKIAAEGAKTAMQLGSKLATVTAKLNR